MTEEEEYKIKRGHFYAWFGIIWLVGLLFFEQVTGQTFPFLMDIFLVFTFFMCVFSLIFYQCVMYFMNE